MALLYYDPIYLEHDTGRHPENAGRLRTIWSRLELAGVPALARRPRWEPISLERLERVHQRQHIDAMRQACLAGGGMVEQDTVVSRQSFQAARMAAGAVVDAVERVVRGESPQALCLVRPPGHHARPAGPMGFCLFGNIALGARLAVEELGLDRVLIIDWDVHHGNGTQEIFWHDPAVGFYSIHRWPFYPGTGDRDETGAGAGLGFTCNEPVPFGTSRAEILQRFQTTLTRFADRLQPQLVLVSAGFDAHRRDPIGSLGLETEDFGQLTHICRQLADAHCAGRIVSVLEGGYDPAALAESVELHWETLTADTEP